MWSLYLLWLIETGECIHSSARSSANTHYFQHSLVYVCITILLPFRDDTDVIDKLMCTLDQLQHQLVGMRNFRSALADDVDAVHA